MEEDMRSIAKVITLGLALTALPALAGPVDDHDPFSQGYTGRDPQELRAERDREQHKASPCEAPCPCGHVKQTEKSGSKS
jgi:hypothetical protein